MVENRAMMFGDMLYLVEQELKNNVAFRIVWQGRFSHVVVDESQDCNYQSIRILVTLSLNPGDNRVYDNKELS